MVSQESGKKSIKHLITFFFEIMFLFHGIKKFKNKIILLFIKMRIKSELYGRLLM